jgi:pimeloyl-ACP methyl ester carboxylesterase
MVLPKPIPMRFFEGPSGRFAYLDEGEGEPIVLIHGFGSTAHVNWVFPGWFDTLTKAGRRVIAMDNRGHGQSAKFYEPEAYHTERMVEDIVALTDHLGVSPCDVMGYSMGARITAFLSVHYPERVKKIVLSGLGYRLIEGVGLPATIADALVAEDRTTITGSIERMFRAFAEQTKADRPALAACILGSRNVLSREEVEMIQAPALVVVGTKDDIAGDPQRLADLLPHGRALILEGKDHMSAVGDRGAKAGVVEFLAEPSEAESAS